MIEHDFPVLRDTVKDSLIGRSVIWLFTAIKGAAADASVTKRIAALRSTLDVDTPEVVRMCGIALAVAAIAAWGLSQLIPRYVATAIPGAAFVAVAAVGALAAGRADAVAGQWRTSRLHRFMAWLSA